MTSMQAEAVPTGDQPFDPVLLAVIANRLDGVVREMTNTLLRTGRSAILNTARDFSCSIVTAGNELLSAAEGLPIHIVGSQYLADSMTRLHPDLREGDAFLHNDPYDGNTHHADHTVLVPVFYDGEHLLTAVAKAHQADCGNSQPTTYAAYARDVYEEGALNFPCVRVEQDYRHVADVIRMARARLRVPDQWYGDFLAMLGAARIGEQRLKELLAKYGTERFRAFCGEWFDYSERLMVQAIRTLPAGRLTGTGRHDPVPQLLDGIPLRVDVAIDPEAATIELDLRDNIDCVPAGFNLSRATAMSSVVIGAFNQLRDPVPNNEGSLRRIRVRLRENCVAGIPVHPTSCSVATTNVADRLINITQAAFAELGDGFGLAEGAVGQGPGFGVISGRDERRGAVPYVNQVYFASAGGPAGPDADGWLFYGIPVAGGLMYRDSIEVAEQKYPILIDEVRLQIDSEGAGRQRGAPGARVAYRPVGGPMTVAYVIDGHDAPPRGVRGGGATVAHQVFRERAGGTVEELDTVATVELLPGERILTVTNGGGGYGDPLERDPERVRADVEAKIVSVERAREVYGVVLRPDGAVDEAATSAQRRRNRA
jgi:N-methylhydantoinase B